MKKRKAVPDEEFLAGSIQKGDATSIRVFLKRFGGNFSVDIREYVETEKYEGPTRKGVFFSTEEWEAFYSLIQRLDEMVRTKA